MRRRYGIKEIREQLQQLVETRRNALSDLRCRQARQHVDFVQSLDQVLDKVRGDIQETLNVSGPGHSLTPDTAAEIFKVTAGKLERSRLQIAYSKTCLYISNYLGGHGVAGLPAQQQSASRSLNTVMVAVMGVSVKYREDLRQIFCEPSGRERLHQRVCLLL
jgi:hypothetical protein